MKLWPQKPLKTIVVKHNSGLRKLLHHERNHKTQTNHKEKYKKKHGGPFIRSICSISALTLLKAYFIKFNTLMSANWPVICRNVWPRLSDRPFR